MVIFIKVFITRHGQTLWNVLEKLQGQTDIELSDVGREQAKEAGEKIKNEQIDLIITSPLKRAKETAQIINKNLNVPILEDDRLKERGFGNFEGMTISKIQSMKEENPEINDMWNFQKNISIENIETTDEFYKRISNFLDETLEKYKDKNILLVSHGGTSVPIQVYLMKYDIKNVVDRSGVIKGLKNCEVKIFDVKKRE